MVPPYVVALWVLAGMVGAWLELRMCKEGRHPNADAMRWMVREHPALLLVALLFAAVTGPVNLAAAASAYLRAEPSDPPEE